jgi:hypothetical protein
MFKRAAVAFSLLVLLLAPNRARAFWGIADTSDGILSGILAENVEEVAQVTETVAQLKQMLQNAREAVSIARDAYAGLDAIRHGDVGQYLQQARSEFERATGVSDAMDLYTDVQRNGMHGGYFDPNSLAHRILSFKARITAQTSPTSGQPGCVFRPSRSAIPVDADHPFRPRRSPGA